MIEAELSLLDRPSAPEDQKLARLHFFMKEGVKLQLVPQVSGSEMKLSRNMGFPVMVMGCFFSADKTTSQRLVVT